MAHHRVKDGELVRAGPLRIFMQTMYARNEARVLRIFDLLIRNSFLRGPGRPILKAMARILGFLPTAEIVTLERSLSFIDAISQLENAEIAVGPCVCQYALGKRKGTYMKDLVVLFGAEAYKRANKEYHDLSPEEAKQLLRQLHSERTMQAFYACMHSGGWVFVICSCEREICLPFRAHQVAGAVMHHGPDVVILDQEKCAGCGTCVEACHFGANKLNGTCAVKLANCYGCGLCVSSCPSGARRMVKRENYSTCYYPMKLVSNYTSNDDPMTLVAEDRAKI